MRTGDSSALDRTNTILDNVLLSAVEATPPGGKVVCESCRAGAVGRSWVTRIVRQVDFDGIEVCEYGGKKRIVAPARSISVPTTLGLCAAKLSDDENRHAEGEAPSDYYERRDTDRVKQRAIRTLERLGLKVTVEAAA